MPLLMCPNCNSNMQALNRNNVEFDMCPTCRGVWLDRGELEKIIESARADASPSTPQAAAPTPTYTPQPQRAPPTQHSYGEHGEYGERGEHGERGGYSQGDPRRRKRGFDLFDMFD